MYEELRELSSNGSRSIALPGSPAAQRSDAFADVVKPYPLTLSPNDFPP